MAELQRRYYSQMDRYSPRTGPITTTAQRVTRKVAYDRNAFTYPAISLAPAVVIQERFGKTTECQRQAGTQAVQRIHENAVRGSQCALPYECDADLQNDQTELLTCFKDESEATFFGAEGTVVEGQLQFTEFLTSIIDQQQLMRTGEAFQTGDFIDMQTKVLKILLALYSPEYGMLTQYMVTAEFGTRIRVSGVMMMVNSIEGAALVPYYICIVLSLCLVCTLAFNALFNVARWRKTKDEGIDLKGAFLDLLLVAMFCIYCVLRLVQTSNSGDELLNIVDSFVSIPWSKAIPISDKVETFNAAISGMETKMNEEKSMNFFGFFLALFALLRIIMETASHPRIAMLVNTIKQGLDDFIHFLILLVTLYFCFALLAWVQFGGQIEEFSTLPRTVETQWNMMLGALPEDFLAEPLFGLFIFTFNIVVFFLMLNFLLAIIVEAYLAVKTATEELQVEEAFYSDIAHVWGTFKQEKLRRWPPLASILKAVQDMKSFTVGFRQLQYAFPKWENKSIESFIKHFLVYECIAPLSHEERQAAEDGKSAANEVESRMACMLGMPKPSPYAHLVHKRDTEGNRKYPRKPGSTPATIQASTSLPYSV